MKRTILLKKPSSRLSRVGYYSESRSNNTGAKGNFTLKSVALLAD